MKLVRFGAAGQEKPGLLDAHGLAGGLEGQVDDIACVSQFMTLLPGDIVTAGVGLGMKPPQFLKPGDVMRLEMGLSHQQQTLRLDRE